MKVFQFSVLALYLSPKEIHCFLSPVQLAKKPSFVLKAGEEYEGLLSKLDATNLPVPPAPPMVSSGLAESGTKIMTKVVETLPPPPPPPQISVPPSLPEVGVSIPDIGGDLPILPIAIAAIVVVAGLTLLNGGGTSAPPGPVAPLGAQATAPTPSIVVSTGLDLSIPYDAAARLAYESSDKKMAFEAFKTKYEADAVAEVKAKRSKV